MKLYVTAGCPSSTQTLVAAKIAQTPLEVVFADVKTIKSKEFQVKTPLGQTPLLETPNGNLWESGAISEYLLATGNGTGNLLGESPLERSQVSQWVGHSKDIAPNVSKILSSLTGQIPYNKDEVAKARNSVKLLLETLEKTLKVSAHLVGSKSTYADVAIVALLSPLLRLVLEEKYVKSSFPTVAKWYESTASLPGLRAVLGAPRFCPKPLDFPAPKDKAAPKPAAAPKKAAEKPAEAAKPKPADEKPKDPMDLLPPTSTDLNALKFAFVNEKDRKVAFQKFWETLDLEGWSFWHLSYEKAEGEGRVLFQTANMLGGFLQRCDLFRKYGLAVHGMYGEEPNLEIRGMWMWRGQDKLPHWSENYMADYYQFVKLDPKKAEDKARIEEYWTNVNEGESCEGMKVQEVRWFK